MEQDRRRFKRTKGTFKVTCEPSSGIPVDWTCDTRDISEVGIGLIHTREPITGSIVYLMFSLPGSEAGISTQARVKWTKASAAKRGWFDSGIEFLEIDEKSRALIRNFAGKN
jgi:hypothetical protein